MAGGRWATVQHLLGHHGDGRPACAHPSTASTTPGESRVGFQSVPRFQRTPSSTGSERMEKPDHLFTANDRGPPMPRSAPRRGVPQRGCPRTLGESIGSRCHRTPAGCATATTTVPWRPSAPRRLQPRRQIRIDPRRERDKRRAVVGCRSHGGRAPAPAERPAPRSPQRIPRMRAGDFESMSWTAQN